MQGLTDPVRETIELAEGVIFRERRLYRFAEINVASARVNAARTRLVEGGNPIGREVSMLLEALNELENARMRRDQTRAEHWQIVATKLLAFARDTLFAAMQIEHARPTP